MRDWCLILRLFQGCPSMLHTIDPGARLIPPQAALQHNSLGEGIMALTE